MMQGIRKELRYGLRSYRFLILSAAFLFFAMLDPVMNKLILPEILKSQMPGLSGEAMAQMTAATQADVMRSYMGDVFEIVSIIVAFSLSGLLAQEIRDATLVLPICSGKRFGGIVFAKLAVFGAALLVIPAAALLVDYAYAGMLYTFELPAGPVLRAGLLQGIFMVFMLALIMMWGAISKKPTASGFLTLASVYGLHFLGGALGIGAYLPSGLLEEASLLAAAPGPRLTLTLGITIGLTLALASVTLLRLKTMEWTGR